MQEAGEDGEEEQRSKEAEHRVQAVEHDVDDDHDAKRYIPDALDRGEYGISDVRYCIHMCTQYIAEALDAQA